MLTDKHIYQWATYLIEEIPGGDEIIKTMSKEMDQVLIDMYKKGYQDCLEDNK